MKWKILALLGLFTASLTVVAQVLLTNLDQKSFVIDVTGPPTNVANLNLRRSQFSPSTTGWFITNVTGVTGISTNISTNDIWTIDGFGDIHPAVTNNQVTVTNLVVGGNLTALGTLNLFKKSQLLSLGTNVLGSDVSTMFYCVSPTNDASQVILSLNDGSAPGQLLLIVNYTNAVPANGAFTLPKNSLVSGGGHVIQPEDWIATNTFAALYTWQSPDWLMIDAFAANGQSVFQTNYFQNIVVYSNITLRGNSTLTINNITLTTNDLWHTNLVGGAATLQPVNLGLQPLVGKGWLSGTNTPASGLLPLSLPFNVLSSVRSEDIGDPAASYMYIAQARNNNNPKSFLSFVASTNALAFQLGANDGTDQSTMNFVTANGSDMQFNLQKNSTNFTLLYPTRAATLTPYVFDTDKIHTTNNIAEFRNNSTNLFSIDYLGEAIFGPGTTNIIYRQNGYFAIAADEGGYSLLNFGTNYGTLSSYVGSSPLGGILSTTGAQLDFGVSSGQLTFDGSVFTPRTSNTVTLASSINPWVDIYLHDGLHIGTNTLTSNGSSPSSPLWNGSALGGGGGSTLWYAYTLADAEGGTVYGTGSTNSFYPNMVRFSNNKLTNFWGTFSGSLSAGWSTPDPGTLDATENVAIFNIGDLAGNGMSTTNGFDIYNFGDGAGNLMTITGAAGQSAGDIFNFGNVAGQQMAASKNSKNIYNFGTFAGQQMTLYGSQQIYHIGDSAGRSSQATNSTDIYVIGQNAGRSATYQTSSDIFAFGNASLQNSVLTNSTDVIGLGGAFIGVNLTNSSMVTGIGRDSGNSIAGAFTNMVFIGAGATAGSGSANQVVIGPGMSLIAPAITLQGQSLFTTLTNKVLKSGDTMTGTLLVTGLTNSARTANTFVVSGADKSDVSTGTSAMLAATLSDETGTGASVFGTSPTFNTSLTLTNPTTGTIAMVINQASGGTVTNFLAFNLGGTNWMYFDHSGQIFGRSSTTGPGALLKFTDTGNIAVTRFDVPTRNYVTLGFSPGVGLTSAGQVSWSNSTTDSTSAETILTRDSQNVIQIGTDGINVLTYAMKAGDGSGTDKGGSHYATKGGQSTGSGPPGDLIYQTSLYTNSSGNTANPYTTRGQVIGRPCALTNATATSFQRFTMATNTQAGINIFATVKATDAAFARQSISSYVRVDAVNVNGTITATVSETDNTLAASTGTLTIAYTVVDEGSNVLAIRANANTSLTATPSIKWIITGINSDGAITVTPVQL